MVKTFLIAGFFILISGVIGVGLWVFKGNLVK